MRTRIRRTKLIIIGCLGLVLAVAGESASAQDEKGELPHYKVTDLGTLGGLFSMAFGLNNGGHVGGGSSVSSGNQHAFLWERGHMIDLSTLGGPNSGAGAPNGRDELPIFSDMATADPFGEDFCGLGTHLVCLGAVWKEGALKPLPTLGGTNGAAIAVNNRGQVVGYAENSKQDKSCASATPFQVLRYEAVLWGRKGNVHELPPLPGDTVGFALGINDAGQVVGSTGICGNTPLFPLQIGPHAVLWQDGAPIDLGSLGRGASNTAAAINNRGEVVGGSQTSGGALHTFLWTKEAGMRDLGTVGTDLGSLPGGMGGINNRGQVVGASCVNDPLCNLGNPNLHTRAYLWQKGQMRDLNSLVVGDSPLYLLFGFGINDVGEIAGFGVTGTGKIHAFLATPCDDDDETD
jgi:probable HAF family extracellular repeat protein